MKITVDRLILVNALAISSVAMSCSAQTPGSAAVEKSGTAEKPASYSGCVSEISSAPGNFVLATADRCVLLDAADAKGKLAGHDVVLKGVVSEASGMVPATLHVRSTVSVKAACTRTCTLPAPGTRGAHGSERPGHEGGTPGEKTEPRKPQSQP